MLMSKMFALQSVYDKHQGAHVELLSCCRLFMCFLTRHLQSGTLPSVHTNKLSEGDLRSSDDMARAMQVHHCIGYCSMCTKDDKEKRLGDD